MKRYVILFLITVFACSFLVVPLQSSAVLAYASDNVVSDFCQDIGSLFSQNTQSNLSEQVYLGGQTLGMTIDGDGVTVVGLNEFVGTNGKLCCPALQAGLQVNDVIVQLDEKAIHSSTQLVDVAKLSKGSKIKVKFLRGGVLMEKTISPCKDLTTNSYRLGLWTKDCSSGIGTLTYVRKNNSFASLGHPICDAEGNVIKCSDGGVFACDIRGVKRGLVGNAGELSGVLNFEMRMGTLFKNNKFGAFGSFDRLPDFCNQLIDVADISEIKPGSAKIYCTLDETGCKSYDIKIVRACYQPSANDKGMVILVTDEELLQKTGGIVQGMSGSPIVQNGKLVGAVTHVFVNDPTRGYGIYAKWMLEN